MPARREPNGIFKALKHPLRREILRAMAGKPELSPLQISELVEEPLPNTSYHVRVLRENDAVKLVREQQVAGAMQHFYAFDVDEPWALAYLGLDESSGESDASA
jgi:DNA-binding transcriptional ArsR family regulator